MEYIKRFFLVFTVCLVFNLLNLGLAKTIYITDTDVDSFDNAILNSKIDTIIIKSKKSTEGVNAFYFPNSIDRNLSIISTKPSKGNVSFAFVVNSSVKLENVLSLKYIQIQTNYNSILENDGVLNISSSTFSKDIPEDIAEENIILMVVFAWKH